MDNLMGKLSMPNKITPKACATFKKYLAILIMKLLPFGGV
jgi:hypothetical protein